MVRLICPVCYQRVSGRVYFTQYHGEKPIRCRHEETPEDVRGRIDKLRELIAAATRPTDVQMMVSQPTWAEHLTWALDLLENYLTSTEEAEAELSASSG